MDVLRWLFLATGTAHGQGQGVDSRQRPLGMMNKFDLFQSTLFNLCKTIIQTVMTSNYTLFRIVVVRLRFYFVVIEMMYLMLLILLYIKSVLKPFI